MNLVQTIDQYNDACIFFCDPIKNNIMDEGNFIRIIYSSNRFMLNGVYLLFTLKDVVCESYFNKFKCSFNTALHKPLIDRLKSIEEQLLRKYSNKTTTQIQTPIHSSSLQQPLLLLSAGKKEEERATLCEQPSAMELVEEGEGGEYEEQQEEEEEEDGMDMDAKKPMQLKIHEQLRMGYIKLFAHSECSHLTNPSFMETAQFVLKIAGVWETDHNYGLTYKFSCPTEWVS